MRSIKELDIKTFRDALHLFVEHSGSVEKEQFVVSGYGGRDFAVSVQTGLSYTRPQLIEKYQNVGAVFFATPRPAWKEPVTRCELVVR